MIDATTVYFAVWLSLVLLILGFALESGPIFITEICWNVFFAGFISVGSNQIEQPIGGLISNQYVIVIMVLLLMIGFYGMVKSFIGNREMSFRRGKARNTMFRRFGR